MKALVVTDREYALVQAALESYIQRTYKDAPSLPRPRFPILEAPMTGEEAASFATKLAETK